MGNGSEIRMKMANRSVDTPIMDTEITQPNMNKVKQNLVDGELAERMFPQPGRYQIKVEFSYLDFSSVPRQNVTIVSNPITVDIDEPNGNDRRAYDYLKQIYQPVNNRGNITEILQKRKYFVNNFKNSVYWKYMTFQLANTYLIFNRNVEAEEELFEISDIEFYHTKQVEDQLLKLSKKLGRPVPRSKRPPILANAPVAIPIPAPTVYTGPPPSNPPVLIPIPNPIVNPSPLVSPSPLPSNTSVTIPEQTP